MDDHPRLAVPVLSATIHLEDKPARRGYSSGHDGEALGRNSTMIRRPGVYEPEGNWRLAVGRRQLAPNTPRQKTGPRSEPQPSPRRAGTPTSPCQARTPSLSLLGVCVTTQVCVSFRGVPRARDDEESRSGPSPTMCPARGEISRFARNDRLIREVTQTPLAAEGSTRFTGKLGEAIFLPLRKFALVTVSSADFASLGGGACLIRREAPERCQRVRHGPPARATPGLPPSE